MPSSGIPGSYGSSICNFLRNLHAVFHTGCISLHSHIWCRMVPLSPHLLQHLLLVDFFNDSHSGWCEEICHCSFDLHFSNNSWCWASFHMPLGHQHVFFGEMSVSFSALFFLDCFLDMSCLCILKINSLSALSFASIFSHSAGCLFILLRVSLAVFKFA